MKKSFIFIILFLNIFIFSGCAKNRDFDKYMDELFIETLKDDPLSINFSLRYPENYDLSNQQVTAIEISKSAYDLQYLEIDKIIKEIKSFNYKRLSKEQKLTYDIVLEYYETKLLFKDYYYYDRYFGSYLGYQAQLPIVLAEYHFYTKKDIEDYLLYLKTAKDSFSNLLEYEKEKVALGLSLPDFIIDGVIEQCTNFIAAEECYLIPIFDEKIDSLDYLTRLEKESYKEKNRKYVEEDFINAYIFLKDEIKELKGKATNNMGLSYFPDGKEYYQVLFKKATGSNMSVNDAYQYLEDKLDADIKRLTELYIKYPDVYDFLDYMDLLGQSDYEEVLEFFIMNCKEDFPTISKDITIKIKEIHSSLEENSSPAMYFLSPIDFQNEEVIYINKKSLSSDTNTAFTTIAHEGVPGHLLQNVYLNTSDLPAIRKSISYIGYSEGWASYVEDYILKYVSFERVGTIVTEEVLEFYKINNRISYVVMGLADIGINYYGWTKDEFKGHIERYFKLSDDSSLYDMYERIIETPTNILTYYFSYYLLLDIKEEYQIKLGNEYNDYDFHKFILDIGPASFDIIRRQI